MGSRDRAIARMQAQLDDLGRRGAFSGVVLVHRGDETLLEASYGYADRLQARPNTPATAFQIASVSKQFTAAAILLLVERRQLALHAPIAAWLPHCPDAWREITVHQLLTHTSGLGHWADYPALDLCAPIGRDRLLETFAARPLGFPPGNGWSYSSPGYVLLAHLVEQVTREPYAAFLRTHIVQRLGMQRTRAGNRSAYPDEQATGYAGAVAVRPFDLDTVGIGAGDVWSTAGDLARWNAALLNGELLAADTREAIFAPHARVPDGAAEMPNLHYGYGWYLTSLGERAVRVHPGGNAGYRACNALLVNGEMADSVIVLANDEQCDAMALARTLVAALIA